MKPFALAVLVSALAISAPAFADLGGAPVLPASSATAPTAVARSAMMAAASTGSSASEASAATSYTVRSETLSSGTVVREYVNTAGEAFAIVWSGPFQPDLHTLMGDAFFQRYTTAIQTAHNQGLSMRTHLSLSTPDMVVEAHGHVRAFGGLAYVPSLLPAGVTPQQLL